MNYINLCANNGMVFNPDKFVFGQDTVKLARFDVTKDSYRPTKKLLDIITNFPIPTDLTGIRSWFGLVQQAAYAFSKKDAKAPLSYLLIKNKKFYWDDHLETLFL